MHLQRDALLAQVTGLFQETDEMALARPGENIRRETPLQNPAVTEARAAVHACSRSPKGCLPVSIEACNRCDCAQLMQSAPAAAFRVRLTGVEEEDISAGFVLCSAVAPCPVVTEVCARARLAMRALNCAIELLRV